MCLTSVWWKRCGEPPERIGRRQLEPGLSCSELSMAFQRRRPAAIGVKAPFPGFIEPEVATSIDKVPSGKRWIHEIKFDGYRVQAHLREAAVKFFPRRGNDSTNRFGKIAADAGNITAGAAIIDGEVAAPAENG